ncbi:MAG: phosphopentomutase [Hyphomicrobiales bacterium]|nr:MAG: phosphopentomutase [Hyphomicrobiales bacterium]
MARAFILVLDSFGIGAAGDADRFGDVGADTFGHIAEACARGDGDCDGLRSGPLVIPNLIGHGLAAAALAARGEGVKGIPANGAPQGLWGFAAETSRGKDTPSGHWEMAGVPVLFDWGYFPHEIPCFPASLTEALISRGDLSGILGNCHASGTEIIKELGEEHIRTGKPICYTSADSVFQIAAHEDHFGLERLMALCKIARELVDPLNIGRVIARPFVGEDAESFVRTANRRDFSVPPPAPTLLDVAKDAGRSVIAVGKIADIFAHQGITRTVKAAGNDALFDATLDAVADAPDGALVFVNFVDFDMLYGHRRDVAGYAAALEAFDRRMPELEAALRDDDLVVMTADHGCDPTWPGSDHTREYVPVLAFGRMLGAGDIGARKTFADIGASVAGWLKLPSLSHGTSFL